MTGRPIGDKHERLYRGRTIGYVRSGNGFIPVIDGKPMHRRPQPTDGEALRLARSVVNRTEPGHTRFRCPQCGCEYEAALPAKEVIHGKCPRREPGQPAPIMEVAA